MHALAPWQWQGWQRALRSAVVAFLTVLLALMPVLSTLDDDDETDGADVQIGMVVARAEKERAPALEIAAPRPAHCPVPACVPAPARASTLLFARFVRRFLPAPPDGDALI